MSLNMFREALTKKNSVLSLLGARIGPLESLPENTRSLHANRPPNRPHALLIDALSLSCADSSDTSDSDEDTSAEALDSGDTRVESDDSSEEFVDEDPAENATEENSVGSQPNVSWHILHTYS